MNKYNWKEEIKKNKKANIISSEEGLSDVIPYIKINNIEIEGIISTPLSEYKFMDEFIEWLGSRGETFFGISKELKENWNKNTINLKQFKEECVAIHCDTREKSLDLLSFLDKNNIEWSSGNRLICDDEYYVYGENTCYTYDVNGICYGSVSCYNRLDYKIINWEIV
jgi:hypothetical protein